MRKLLAILLLPVLAFAFTVEQSKASIKLKPGDVVEMWFNITSDHEEEIVLYPQGPSGWYRLNNYRATVGPANPFMESFILRVPDSAEDMTVLLRIVADNGTDRDNIDWIIRVERGIVERADIIGVDFPSKLGIGEEASYTVDVKNTGTATLFNLRLDFSGVLNESLFRKSLEPGRVWRVQGNFTVPNLPFGNYTQTITVNTGKEMDKREISVEVLPKPIITEKEWLNIIPIGFQRIKEIRNDGNANYSFREERTIRLWERLVLSTNGKVEGRRIVWEEVIEPGETYRKADGYNILPLMTALALLAMAGVYAAKYFTSPKIRKKVVRKKDGVRIYLEISAPIEMRDVVIEDKVLPIFRVKSSSLKMKTKRGKKYTTLKWMVSRLLAGEERIISYDLEFVLGVKGKLKFPSAVLHGKVGERKVRAETGEVYAEV